jgi:hypothetical protein
MRPVDTDVLREVQKALGIRLHGNAEFDDGVLQQVLDAGPLIRRGGTIFPSDGIYGLTFELDFDGINPQTQSVVWNPYDSEYTAASTTGLTKGDFWPPVMPDNLDAWIIGPLSLLFASAGGGNAFVNAGDGARAYITSSTRNRGIFYPATSIQTTIIPVAFWDTEFLSASSRFAFVGSNEATLTQMQGVAYRLRPGDTFRYSCKVADAITDFGIIQMHARVGLFPSGLGQDAL